MWVAHRDPPKWAEDRAKALLFVSHGFLEKLSTGLNRSGVEDHPNPKQRGVLAMAHVRQLPAFPESRLETSCGPFGAGAGSPKQR